MDSKKKKSSEDHKAEAYSENHFSVVETQRNHHKVKTKWDQIDDDDLVGSYQMAENV